MPVAAASGVTFLIRTFPRIENVTGHLLEPGMVIGTFSAGVFSASYCLLRIRNENLGPIDTVAHFIVQAIGIAIASITILIFGCGIITGNLR